MGQNVMMTHSLSMAAAKAAFSEIASRAHAGERFALLRRDKLVAAVVGPGDLERLEKAGQADEFCSAVERFRAKNRNRLPAAAVRVARSRGRRVR